VVLNADPLSDAQMRTIAADVGFSEMAFLREIDDAEEQVADLLGLDLPSAFLSP